MFKMRNKIHFVIFFILFTYLCCSVVLAETSENTITEVEQKKYYVNDIKQAMMEHIKSNIDENGIFRIMDERTGEVVELIFVKIHDPVRVIDSNTYFACTDFHVVGIPNKLYDLDFWMNPEDNVLKIYKSKIHKEPRRSFLYGWYKQPRYTFVKDKIVPLY